MKTIILEINKMVIFLFRVFVFISVFVLFSLLLKFVELVMLW